MKLKRFLLRYDPPGVGLEVEGQDEPIHKDLPPSEQITTSKDICKAVDQLIMDEPTLLTRKRHRPALMKLLSRLYQVELDDEDEGGEKSGVEGADSSKHPEDSSVFQEGQQVVLINLKQKLMVHNGEIGILGKVNAEKEKYEVILQGQNEWLKVKGAEHLVPIAPKGTQLAVGTHVAIRGLRNHIELNGCLGRVVECHKDSHRFEVRATESGQLFRVKQENLVPIENGYLPVSSSAAVANPGVLPKAETSSPRSKKDLPNVGAGAAGLQNINDRADRGGEDETFEPGCIVKLVGLKTAMCYNGQTAEVLSVDKVRCRYEIKLTDGSVKTIRAENVQLVSRNNNASKRSPRK